MHKKLLLHSAKLVRGLNAQFDDVFLNSSANSNVLRTLHTVKGTAQTVGLLHPAALAHNLESICRAPYSKDLLPLLRKGLQELEISLTKPSHKIPKNLIDEIHAFLADDFADISTDKALLPNEILIKLSQQERADFYRAIRNGASVFQFEVSVKIVELKDFFENLRAHLGERVFAFAVFPGSDVSSGDSIRFRVIVGARGIAPDLSVRLFDFNVSGFSEIVARKTKKALTDTFWIAAMHGQSVAIKRRKKLQVIVTTQDIVECPNLAESVFPILLHLMRNAVEHAFDESGTVEINASINEKRLYLSFKDNGKGLPLQQIRDHAAASGISCDENTVGNVIFSPSFTTTTHLSETSGRGIGLNAVREIVTEQNGTIAVETSDSGTKFCFSIPFSDH